MLEPVIGVLDALAANFSRPDSHMLTTMVIGPAALVALLMVYNLLLIWRRAKNGEDQPETWSSVIRQVLHRRTALKRIREGKADIGGEFARGVDVTELLELSATDLFVEKVQNKLTERGNQHHLLGTAYSYAVFFALLLALLYLLAFAPQGYTLTWPGLLGRIAANGAVVGIFLGAAFFLGSLARSHLHEATVLFNKRHMVRLGRLFLYLKFAGLSGAALMQAKEKLNVEDIERAFGSVHETSTAFKTIKVEILTSTIFGQFAKAFSEVAAKKKD
jgi:hypothetical protein